MNVGCSVKLERMNGTELVLNHTEVMTLNETYLEEHEVLCSLPVTNDLWQMASGYIGAVLMMVMAVYARYGTNISVNYGCQPCCSERKV